MIPHFDQYLGLWAIEEQRFAAGQRLFDRIDLHLHMQGPDPDRARRDAERYETLQVVDGVAVISLHGVLMKQASSMMASTSTVLARRLVRQAKASADVRAAIIHCASPGGTVAGTFTLAEDVGSLAKAKPTIAYCEDLCASACYAIAAQAGKIVSHVAASVGSIGTYGVVHDMSGLAAKEGIKVHVLRAGKYKGMGTAGTEITAEQLAEFQRSVDEANEMFVRSVASGRSMSLARVRALADGRVHSAQQAKEMGLVDAVQSLDETFARLAALSKSKSQSK
jgi:signal peptide peptidase SppA